MNAAHSPLMTVVMVAQTGSRSFHLALEQLRAQTIASTMEVLLVTSGRAALGLSEADREGFASLRLLELGAVTSNGAAKAAAVRAASAPLVAFVEDHSYPSRECMELFRAAHLAGGYAVVGPAIGNANPTNSVSWGAFLVFYSQWMASAIGREVRHLPGNQSCYRKEVLVEYGSRLEEMIESESVLHWDLAARGRRLLQVPGARVYHMNYSRLGAVVAEFFFSSRAFAAGRSSAWAAWRRCVYAAGSPLIPFVRLPRILGDAVRANLPVSTLLGALPAAVVALFAGAAGEMLGYALGAGDARASLIRFEANRDAGYREADLQAAARLRRA